MKLKVLAVLILLLCLFCAAAQAEFTLPADTQVIEAEAFSGNRSIQHLWLPDNLQRIETKAFYNCGISTVYLPSSLECIAEDAFNGNTGMKAVAEPGTYAYNWASRKGFIKNEAVTVLMSHDITVASNAYTRIEYAFLAPQAYAHYGFDIDGESDTTSVWNDTYSRNTPIIYGGTASVGDHTIQVFVADEDWNKTYLDSAVLHVVQGPTVNLSLNISDDYIVFSDQESATLTYSASCQNANVRSLYAFFFDNQSGYHELLNEFYGLGSTESQVSGTITLNANDFPEDGEYEIVFNAYAINGQIESKTVTVVKGNPVSYNASAYAYRTDCYIVSWDSVPDATGYYVFYSIYPNETEGRMYNYITENGSKAHNAHIDVYPGNQYYFEIYAVGPDYSIATGLTDECIAPLPAPANFQSTNIGTDGTVDLCWDDVEGANAYRVYRSLTDDVFSTEIMFDYTSFNQPSGPLNLIDLGGVPGQTVYLWVAAENDNGPGIHSNRLAVMIPSSTPEPTPTNTPDPTPEPTPMITSEPTPAPDAIVSGGFTNDHISASLGDTVYAPLNISVQNGYITNLYFSADYTYEWNVPVDSAVSYNESVQILQDVVATSGEHEVSVCVYYIDLNENYHTDWLNTVFITMIDPASTELTVINSNPTIYCQTGETTTLNVSVSGGDGNYSFVWYKGSTVVGYTQQLTLSNLTTSDTGEYHCVVTSGSQTKTSSTTYLEVRDPFRIVSHPSNKTVNEGASVDFNVEVAGGSMYSLFFWYRAANTWEEGECVGNNQTLTFTATAADNGYYYYCEVENGAETLTTNRAKLTVISQQSSLPAPSGFAFTGIAKNSVTVKFNDVSGASGYYVYYSTNSTFKQTNSKVSASYRSGSWQAEISGLSSGTRYYFWASAYDSSGNIGDTASLTTITPSVSITVRNQDTGAVYQSGQVYDYSLSSINLSWTVSNGNGTQEFKSFAMTREPSFDNTDSSYIYTGAGVNGYFYGSASSTDESNSWTSLPIGLSDIDVGKYVKVWIGARDVNYSTNGVVVGVQFALKKTQNVFDPIWPCASTYTITCLYKYSDGTAHSTRYETAIDIGGGGNIIATEAGTVITATTLTGSFGNYVVIDHGNDMVSLYGHLSSRDVEKGDYVTKGQLIGVMGQTGNANGVHLHFELANKNTKLGDPWKDYFRSKYVNVLVYHQNCYLNNNPQDCKNWIIDHCYLNGSYYYPKNQ